MNSREKKKLDMERRGKIIDEELKNYVDLKTTELTEMLNGETPKKRTIAASILGDRAKEPAIIPLCISLKSEKALYPRIAMSEALSKIGEPAVPHLINLLGEIGNNQETELPKKYFNKKSYPLARDMTARTLVKIGKPATPYLMEVIESGTDFKAQQAIDAIGGIAAKTEDRRALKVIINRMERCFVSGDKITLWKTVRALSGFKSSEEAVDPLILIIKSDYDFPIIWEALRSLGQLGVKTPELMELIIGFTKNDNTEVSKAALNALIDLNKQ